MSALIVVNQSKHISTTEVAAMISAARKWVKPLAAAWDCAPPSIHSGSTTQSPFATFGACILQDGLDVAGAAGYHDVVAGRPILRVDVQGCLEAGMSPTVCFSHEVAEALIDPWCFAEARYARDSTIALELCDPCEADQFAIDVDGVLLSDYVLPAYFGGGPGPYDAAGHLTAPAPAILPGGYASVCIAGVWKQIAAHSESLTDRQKASRRHALRVQIAEQREAA